jgi:hypothetical protein
LPAAAQNNGDRSFGLAHDHVETSPAHADDLARPDDGRIETTVQQKLFRLPALAQPGARCIG